MIPALFLIPLVALFRIFLAWQSPAMGVTHPWLPGSTPLAAVALCAGLFLPRRLALVIPLGVLLLSDAIVDFHYGAHFFSPGTLVNYTLLALIGLAGMTARRSVPHATHAGHVLGTTLAAAVFFYVGTTFAVWLGSPDYPHTAAGLLQALTLGLPQYSPPAYVFFRNGLVSDALYSMVFVACVRLTLPRGERARSSTPAANGSGAAFADARSRA